MKKLLFYSVFSAALLLTACTAKQWVLTDMQGSKIALGAETEATADKEFKQFLEPFKLQLGQQMNEVIGVADQDMRGHKPESLLSNWNADVFQQAASEWLGETVETAIVNLGGLRTPIPAGPITVGKIYELMPFENELVILWLKGSDLEELLQYFATIGGQGVGGIRMRIQQGKAIDIKIAGQPLEKDRVYTIATNDYLAEGNDYMVQLKRYVRRENSGILIRDMLMNHIRRETAAGKTITAKLEGRIVHEDN
jgi:2',3'-cyclic-nucleotide 2'-phosphodiesterase (5'-nucleotidase family)